MRRSRPSPIVRVRYISIHLLARSLAHSFRPSVPGLLDNIGACVMHLLVSFRNVYRERRVANDRINVAR